MTLGGVVDAARDELHEDVMWHRVHDAVPDVDIQPILLDLVDDVIDRLLEDLRQHLDVPELAGDDEAQIHPDGAGDVRRVPVRFHGATAEEGLLIVPLSLAH